ncbi:hypothetical protein MATR_25390 [Marivirga tractuosa]|uniref:glycosyltransferase n=1 Tax=Marivirga tractuosa TaxID=1006 RepID=UPI00030E4854|nr:glycosyltransferase [Marivirga tractuosa]BDD15714.1 hypothetical protein MATR_25390 [Marivirga tractuosa]
MPETQNNKITVIIPTLNEADNIGKLIQYLKQCGQEHLAEIIVCDAGSEDATVSIVKENEAQIIQCKQASRAHQMNEGAKMATGDILYFVHADAKPPKSFATDLVRYINKGLDFGCYRFKFDSKHPFLAVNSFLYPFQGALV